MTLTIHKLTTRCRSPRGFGRPDALLSDVARGALASELSAQLGPSLDRLPEVVRIKQLRVRVKIPARTLSAASLVNAWARAITLALHQAVASPAADGAICSRRYPSQAAYRAAMLYHIANQGLAPCWEFPELKGWIGISPAEASLGMLLADPNAIAEIIAQLDRNGWLEPLLNKWDELSLERIMQAVAGCEMRAPGLSLDNLIELGHAAAASGGLRSSWSFAGRRQAIRLWVRLHPLFPLRGVWHGLRLLQRCLELPPLLILRDPSLLADRIPFPQWCEAIIRTGDRVGLTATPVESAAVRSGGSLLSVLHRLRVHVPSAAAPNPASAKGMVANTKWYVSDYAGLLLMLSVVQRLNLWRFTREPAFLRFGGPRALSFLLAGVGMNLLRPWSVGDPLDPIVALFAGMFEGPDLPGMRQFFRETDVVAIAEFVPGQSWEEALDHAAAELSRSFASRVRGFRQASREAVWKQFIRIPGRVLVEEARLLVVLDPTPWAPALHLSGMDESLPRVDWLEERRVEFVMEGL